MKFSKQFLKEMEIAEGMRKHAYDDATGRTVDLGLVASGNVTIGIGCNIHNGISDRLARHIFDFQMQDAYDSVLFVFPFFDALTAARKEALIEMCFNLGISRLMKFKLMLAALKDKDYERAARECLNSDAARNHPDRYRRIANKLRHG